MPPGHSEAILQALSKGEIAEAEALCEEYLRVGGGGEALYLLGLARARGGDLAGGRNLIARAAQLEPGRADIAYNFGVMLREAGDARAAALQWRRAIGLDPARKDALGNLALILGELGELGEARECWRQAAERWPSDRDTLFNYGNFLQRHGPEARAREIYTALVERHPGYVPGWINSGMMHKRRNDPAAAEACYRRAIAIDHNSALAHFNLANLLLQQGRWREGWTEYEWRLALPDAARLTAPPPPWNATRPAGSRVLIWAEQGFGDSLQFLRYVPKLAARGYRCLLLLPRELHRLAAALPGVERIFGLDEPVPQADCEVSLGSLPYRLGEISAEGGWEGPYLSASNSALPPNLDKRAINGAVGLIWGGDPAHPFDQHRSASLAAMAPLFDIKGVRWVSLQTRPRAQELATSPLRGAVQADLAPFLTDFAATAAIMARLSLVISVDTAGAHLAGALGQPAWVMVSATESDWRWGTTERTTPWYPSLRLFRQHSPGDWGGVVTEIAEALSAEKMDQREDQQGNHGE